MYDDDSSTESIVRNTADPDANQINLTVEGKNQYGYDVASPLLPNYQENKPEQATKQNQTSVQL